MYSSDAAVVEKKQEPIEEEDPMGWDDQISGDEKEGDAGNVCVEEGVVVPLYCHTNVCHSSVDQIVVVVVVVIVVVVVVVIVIVIGALVVCAVEVRVEANPRARGDHRWLNFGF